MNGSQNSILVTEMPLETAVSPLYPPLSLFCAAGRRQVVVKRVLKDPELGPPGGGVLTDSELRCFRESGSSRLAACVSEEKT